MTPLLSYASVHYVRLFVKVKKGIVEADKCLDNLGFISHCFNCGAREWKFGLAVHIEEKCLVCGLKTSLAGPLWLGRLHDREFCDLVIDEVVKREFIGADKLISTCRDELEIPMHYDVHKVCKMLGLTAMSTEDLLSALREKGFQASRTHFSGISFKTDAGMEEIKVVVREMTDKGHKSCHD
jgi:tRNA (guanine26-N2/guanine27-N2)-dimethyltransferase